MESLPSDTPAEKRLWELMCVVYETHSARHELTIRALTLEFALGRGGYATYVLREIAETTA